MEFLLAPFFIFISFFILYSLSKNDFVLIRQNISLGQIFDLALISIFFAFIFGRFFFVINNFDLDLLHLIRFFHFIKFPGTSTLGFFIGGAISIFILFRKRKSLPRIFDIFSLSFLPIYSFNILFRIYPLSSILIPIGFFIFSMLILYFLLQTHNKYKMKDGSVSLLILILLSIDSFVIQLFALNTHKLFIGLSFVQVIAFIVFAFSLIFLILLLRKKHE